MCNFSTKYLTPKKKKHLDGVYSLFVFLFIFTKSLLIAYLANNAIQIVKLVSEI